MHVEVSAGEWGVSGCVLRDGEDMSRFHVVSCAGVNDRALDALLRGDQAGLLEDEHAMIRVDWLRAQLASQRIQQIAAFESMLRYAASRGWLSEDGGLVRAHVVFEAG